MAAPMRVDVLDRSSPWLNAGRIVRCAGSKERGKQSASGLRTSDFRKSTLKAFSRRPKPVAGRIFSRAVKERPAYWVS